MTSIRHIEDKEENETKKKRSNIILKGQGNVLMLSMMNTNNFPL